MLGFLQAQKAWGTVIPIRAISSLASSNAEVFTGHLDKQGKRQRGKRKSSCLVHAVLHQDLHSSLSSVEAKGLAQSHTGNLCGSVLHHREGDKIS